MKQAHKALAAGLVTAASMGMASASHAQTFTETGDAGQTLATAQYTGTTPTPLTGISGNISTTDLDADVYVIDITDPATFSAIVTNTTTIDTSLFLFDASGTPVVANDDQSNSNFEAGLPTGSVAGLPAGIYYLGISLSGNEAVNSAGQQLFTTDEPTTNVRGIASGLNPTTLSTFNGGTFVDETGPYGITLTGTDAIPEPSTYALVIAGVAAGAVTLVRRQRRTA